MNRTSPSGAPPLARSRARARTQVAEGAFEAAIRSLDEVFAAAQDHPDGLKLRDKAQAGIDDRHRRALDQQARRAIADARAQFDRGERREALDTLRAFTPVHPEVTDAIEAWTAELEQLKRDLEEARAQQIADCLEAGLKAAAAGRLDDAANELAEIVRIEPGAAAAAELSRRIEDEREAIARRQAIVALRIELKAALDKGDADLAGRLTHDLAAYGVDPQELEEFRTRVIHIKHDATLNEPPRHAEAEAPAARAEERRREVEPAATVKTERLERPALRTFYAGDYEQALEMLQRIPLEKAPAIARDRILFYMACSHAALALLEGPQGNSRLQKAQEFFRQSQRHQTPFTVDRSYISPRIIGALEGPPAST